MTKNENLHTPIIEAAGGLLWRETPKGRKLALIYRERYDDWTLPKGKRKKTETWQETALREVYEETGYRARLDSFAGCTCYVDAGSPKVVLFWHMEVVGGDGFKPNAEIDDLAWLTEKKAKKRLTYRDEQALID